LIDILAPLGLLLLIALVVGFFVSARKQQAAKRSIFREFAESRGFSYLESDDGTVERRAVGFEGFATSRSPSVGRTPPQDVVAGEVGEGAVWLFRHATRETEGQAREWYICLLATRREWQGFMRITPMDSERKRPREVGGKPVVTFGDPDFDRRFVVRSNNGSGPLNEDARGLLMSELDSLSLLSEIQLKDGVIAVYPADRNAEIKGPEQLETLLRTATGLARALGRD